MGILFRTFFRVGDLDHFQQADRFFLRILPADFSLFHQCLGELLSNPHRRVHTGHRILEDHADHLSADALHLFFTGCYDILSAERDRSLFDTCRRHGIQLHDRLGGNALSASGLTYDGKHFSFVHFEADAAHRMYLACVGIKGNMEIFNFQNFFHSLTSSISGQMRHEAGRPAG